MTHRGARGWINARHAALVVAPWIVLLSACGAARPFSISLVPTAPAPIQVGTQLGFRLSSSTAGYASLYLIDPVGQVSVLAENLPLAAGSLEYPSSAQGFTLTASQPVGAWTTDDIEVRVVG